MTESVQPAKGFQRKIGARRQSEDAYSAPSLFSKWGTLGSRRMSAKLEYLRSRLVHLAEAGALSLTHIHQQPKPIADYAGMILLGLKINDDGQMVPDTRPLDPALRNYVVRVRSLTRDTSAIIADKKTKTPKTDVPERVPLEYKIGKEPEGMIRFRNDPRQGKIADKMVDVFMSSEDYEADLSIQEAWHILHQHGKHCVRAPSYSRQAKMWLYEEIIPDAALRPPSEDGTADPSDIPAPHMRKRTAK